MRVLLVLLLVHGLAPGLGEVVESAVHWARTGHAAHSAADRGGLGDEHGCGTTQHHCTCCATQAIAPAERVAVASLGGSVARPAAPPVRAAAARAPARPFRPPIS